MKERNPQDATRRNTRASRRAETALRERDKFLVGQIRSLELLMRSLHKDSTKRISKVEKDLEKLTALVNDIEAG